MNLIKRNLSGLLVGMASLAATPAFAFEAHLGEVFVGEVDPFMVGDACVISMEGESGGYVVVADFDACTDVLDAKGHDFFAKARTESIEVDETLLKREKRKAYIREIKGLVGNDDILVYQDDGGALEQIVRQIEALDKK